MKKLMNRRVLASESSCIRRFSEWAKGIGDCISLTLGEPDFHTPDAVKQAAVAALNRNLTHYPESAGMRELREKIGEYELKNKGLSYDPDEIIITNGATEAAACVLKSVINPGDEVMVPTPAFGLYRSLIEIYGGKCVPIDTSKDEFQLTYDKLQQSFTYKTKCLVLNYPNNPTGTILQRETAEMIHRFVKERNIFVLCDEVYDTMTYAKGHIRFAAYDDIREKIIVIQSFSKPYAMTGWRVGYVMADREIAEEIFKVHQYTTAGISHFSQAACIEALSCDIAPMKASFQKRTEYVYMRLTNMGIDVRRPQGTFYIFPNIEKYGMDAMEFCCKLAEQEKLVIIPSDCFETDGYARISCCYEQKILEEAMNRMERFVGALSDRGR